MKCNKYKNEPIRVLQVFGRTDRGGAETLMMNVYRNIDRSKIQFDFVVHTKDKCAFDDEIRELGGKIYRVPRYKVYNQLSYIHAWHELFKNNTDRWKIVHGHMFTMAPFYLRIARQYQLKTIVHSHSTISGVGLKQYYDLVLKKQIKNVAHLKLACSKEAGKWLYNNSDFQVIHNSIDLEIFAFNHAARDRIRKQMRIENRFVIGHIGSMQPVKNQTFLIDIFNEVTKLRGDAVLIMIGDGVLREKLENKVAKLNMQNSVNFMGVRKDISELMNAFDVFVLPSLSEGFPVTLIEAQANGLKCLVSDLINRDTNITGLVSFLPLDKPPKLWVKELIKKIDEYSREEKIKLIKEGGYCVIKTSHKLEEIYSKLHGY